MKKDFYVVLGISRDADLGQIQRAYRRLVKLYHPDMADQSAEKFLEIQNAYETLRDDETREDHDKELAEPKPVPPVESLLVKRRVRRTPVASRRRMVEDEVHGLFSAVDEFFSGWVPGFFTSRKPAKQASRQKDLYVELILDRDEAGAGGLFPLQIPTEQVCPSCHGCGSRQDLVCSDCRGRGQSVNYHEIEISVPPGVADGTVARLSLGDIGLSGVDLIVLVSVSA